MQLGYDYVMPWNTEAQREALNILMPEIGPYCERHDLKLNMLLQGLRGIPIDGRKVQHHLDLLLMTRAKLAAHPIDPARTIVQRPLKA